MDKKNIISVLFYPYQNNVVVMVTRSKGYFTYPQLKRIYSIPYSAKNVESFFGWYQKLQSLNEKRIFSEMKKLNETT